jgi:acyl-CoA synthetase (AMP-forming)/AMP-acid ligase II
LKNLGQTAFNSGDLMVMDKFGYIKFCDRLGDTYRWRGENVATIEVENIISKYLNSSETIIYGVEIPGEEGKTGMAAFVKNDNLNLKDLSNYLKDHLPAYARPLFIRLLNDIEYTGKYIFSFKIILYIKKN